MKKLFLAIVFLAIGVNAQTESSFTIPEGTIIKVALDKEINGKYLNAGDKIDFTTTEDLIIGNYVVLKKGLKAIGTVTEAAKSKGLGKKGKLSFKIEFLYLENGKVIKLRNEVTKNLNGSGGVVAATSVVLTPLALFIKGKNAKYEKGAVFEAFIDETTTIN
ncbi:hypothetical protein [Flavobacterium capsici]|uniref:DUF5666 domain-containing protein n=1 Tax=Flavobacterium capsici TaxID=3075618 RepID=A0AA96EY33_9FLAO|nr:MULTISPECIES: hypothetical protein [unclassified Flavobacterium]WNM19245.1 hypothetical protein RN608_00850 [Flavobacterium sp. PMR2A8]WNM20634.1 hypothetical protein RN605_08020 [Flavobacterium sp. PMTSA4]